MTCAVSQQLERRKRTAPTIRYRLCNGETNVEANMSRMLEAQLNEALDKAEAQQSGYAPRGRRELRGLRRLGLALVEPIHGTFVRRRVWKGLNPAERSLWLMRAVAKRHPRWRFCGASAAVALGMPVTWGLLTHVFVTTPPGTKGRSASGVSRHHFNDAEETQVDGLRLTSLWRTVFDCLAAFPGPDGLAIADRALQMSRASARSLVEYVRTVHRGRRGSRRALAVAALADGRAESGGESIARHVMHELGFAMPELQVWIEDPVEPGKWFRVDFLWLLADGSIVIGELDGRQKSERAELMRGRDAVRVLQDERLRESHLTALRPAIVRFGYHTARDPDKLGRLLESFGVPKRRREPARPRETFVTHTELMDLGGWRVLATEELPA